ncbi:hypothetical protein GJAV_G00119890 [Gymnothorax javanicus]|nr:hypothetical protein GJAV_G00119890 [Gymnothorax javanicus]
MANKDERGCNWSADENAPNLEWEGSPILTDYLVTYAPSSPGGVQLTSACQATSPAARSSLPGIEYNLDVLRRATVISSPHASTQVSTLAPPTNLHVRGVTERTIDLEWEGSPILTDYLVTYAPSSPGGVQLDIRVPGNITSCTIAELEPGIEYNLDVYAVLDTVISSPASTQVSTYLSNPDRLLFKSVTETSVEVQWDPLSYPFDGWEISFIPKDNEGGMTAQLPSTITSFNQTGLRPGEEHTVNLVALKDQGRSQPITATVTTHSWDFLVMICLVLR